MRAIPQGKGMFIWQLKPDRIAAPRLAAEQARQAGMSWVIIKGQESIWTYNKERIAEYVQAFSDEGLAVWLYAYIYGKDTLRRSQALMEAQRSVDICETLGADGLVADAEKEYKRKGCADDANIYLTYVRTQAPDLSIGLSAFRFPSLHPEFPWRAFLGSAVGVDFHMPQVYWAKAHNAAEQLVRSVRELRTLRDLPVVPVGPAYTEFGWEPTLAEMTAFFEQVKRLNLPAVAWWEWYFATIRRPQFWPHVAAMEWTHIEPPPPPPTDSELLGRLVEQARLHGWEV